MLDRSVPVCFEERAAAACNSEAVVDSNTIITYGALNARANQVARAIREYSDPKAPTIAIMVRHGVPFALALMAVLKAGFGFVVLIPDAPDQSKRDILDDSACGFLLTDQEHIDLANRLTTGSLKTGGLETLGLDQLEDNLQRPIGADDLGGLFYTSGTTGKPKGVIHSHRNFLHWVYCSTNDLKVSPSDRMLLCYQGGTLAAAKILLVGLLSGATVCVWDMKRHGAAGMAHWLRDQHITYAQFFRTAFSQCVNAMEDAMQFPSVRLVILASEPVYKTDVDRAWTLFPSTDVVINQFAATEIETFCRYRIDRATPLQPGVLPGGHNSVDKDVRVVDDTGQALGPGVVGEIVVRSRYAAHGYWQRPEQTAQSFSACEDDPRVRLYRTGDLGRWRLDGCLETLGRKDEQIKIGGTRVETGHVEAQVIAVAGVQEAVVVPVLKNDGNRMLVAYVAAADPNLTADALRKHLLPLLSMAEMPSAFEFVPALPRLPNGKIDRKRLRAVEIEQPRQASGAIEDATERRVLTILRQALRREDIGRDDDIFSLGADSLTAIEIQLAIEKSFDIWIEMQDLLVEASTLAKLAAKLRQTADISAPTAPRERSEPSHSSVQLRQDLAIGYDDDSTTINGFDIIEGGLFPLIKLLTTAFPERKWRWVSRKLGGLTAGVFSGQAKSYLQTVKRLSPSAATTTDIDTQILDLQSARFEFRMRFFSSPKTWQAPISLTGRDHLDQALAQGRGVILWMMPLKFTEIITVPALTQSNYPVTVLTRPNHGISTTLFGSRLLNRLSAVHFRHDGAERLIIDGDGQVVLDQARQRIRDNGVLAIATGPQSDRPVTMHVFGRAVQLAAGPVRLAIATGAALLPAYGVRHGDNGFRVTIEAPLIAATNLTEGPDQTAVMTRYVAMIEQRLREHPAEWRGWPAFA